MLPYKNKEDRVANAKRWRTANPEKVKDRNRKRGSRYRGYELAYRVTLKQEVLGHYGLHGEAKCVWPECTVDDFDVLTLDHIHNDGAARRKSHRRTGCVLYLWLKRTGYPAGYQTLCMNHQLKKEITRRRGLVESAPNFSNRNTDENRVGS